MPPPRSSFSFRRASRTRSRRSRQSVCSSQDAGAWALARQEKQKVCLQQRSVSQAHATSSDIFSSYPASKRRRYRATWWEQPRAVHPDVPTAAHDGALLRGAPYKGGAVGPGAPGELCCVLHEGHDLPHTATSTVDGHATGGQTQVRTTTSTVDGHAMDGQTGGGGRQSWARVPQHIVFGLSQANANPTTHL